MLINKNTKAKNKRATILIASLAVLALIFGVIFYLQWKNMPTTSNSSDSNQADKNNQQTSKLKDSSLAPSSIPDEAESVPQNTAATVTITQLSQLDGEVTASATVANMDVIQCVYSFTSEGARPVVRETRDSCQPISIPAIEFEKIGTYKLTVTVYDSSSKISSSQDINIE